MSVEFVKKTVMGGYKAVDNTDPELSHIIMNKDDYRRLKAYMDQDQQRRIEADRKVAEAMKQCEQKLNLARLNAQKELKEVKDTLAKTECERDRWAGLNENLLRMQKEKANADRDLQPKKTHTGYAIQTSAEKVIRYKNGNKTVDVFLWETTFQSPHPVDFTEDQARALITEELWPLLQDRLGFAGKYLKGYDEMQKDHSWTAPAGNVLLQQRFKANYKAGYWEVILQHTKPLGAVPADMR